MPRNKLPLLRFQSQISKVPSGSPIVQYPNQKTQGSYQIFAIADCSNSTWQPILLEGPSRPQNEPATLRTDFDLDLQPPLVSVLRIPPYPNFRGGKSFRFNLPDDRISGTACTERNRSKGRTFGAAVRHFARGRRRQSRAVRGK